MLTRDGSIGKIYIFHFTPLYTLTHPCSSCNSPVTWWRSANPRVESRDHAVSQLDEKSESDPLIPIHPLSLSSSNGLSLRSSRSPWSLKRPLRSRCARRGRARRLCSDPSTSDRLIGHGVQYQRWYQRWYRRREKKEEESET